MPTKPEERDIVHEVALYQRRIQVENAAPAAWESDWGFLRSQESLDKDRELEQFEDIVLSDPPGLPSEDSAPFLERLRIWRNLAPKSKFFRPVLSSHELGWRAPIDLFGSNQFGIHRNPELFPQ